MSFFNTLKFITTHPLTRHNKAGALSRFLKWQIVNRLNPYPVVYPFIGDTYLVMEKGMTGATGNLYTGLHEFSDMGFLLHFLREGDLFVDIGANIGSYTILAAGVSKTTTIAIEPSTTTYKKLVRNIRVNMLEDTVRTLNIGLGADRTTMLFTKSLDTINHIVQDKTVKQDVEEIQVDTLDNVVGEVAPTLLLKIDVEGFETEVLNGARSTLSNENLKAIIIELNGSGGRYGYDEEKIHMNFIDLGFHAYTYDPLSRNLMKANSYGSHNTIYIRDIAFVKERISSSDNVNLLGSSF